MGREDSHYRPESGAGRGTGGSASGPATGRFRVPDAHPQQPPADPAGYRAERPPPWRPDAGGPSAGSAPVPPYPGASGPPAGRPLNAGAFGTASAPPPHAGSASVPSHPDLFGPASGLPAAASVPVSPPPAGAAPAAAVPPAPARRRRLLPFVLAAVLLLALAAGVVVVRPGPVAQWLGDDQAGGPASAQPADPPPVPVLAGADANAPLPTQEGVSAALDPLVGAAALGDRVNVSVADVATGQPLFGAHEDDGTVPASVTKLVTAVTVLAARGPGHRIPTRAVAGASPGEVVIVGGGDPTLAVDKKGFYPGAARLDDLAAQVKAALGGTAPTKVTVDSSLYSGPVHEPGWDDDIPTGGYGGAITALMTDGARKDVPQAKRDHDAGDHGAERVSQPDLVAGRAFARLLGVPADAVSRGRAPAAGADATAGAPGSELGKVESLPMVRLVDIMISDSDNIVAEALARQVALARNQPASFTGAAAAMDAVAGELGLPADELSLADGSGLSRTNRISPSLLTDLITLAGNGSRPELAAVFGGLPVAGWSGTLGERYAADGTRSGAGVVRAKTGTLTKVHAIAGLVTIADGRLLTFAVLTDAVPPDGMAAARVALDRIGATLAGCGCR
ncbi:D-alanyl-D-alanine carboxypeptidase / D-alanyl-D-alanine-endopeptidase (penicillin-binding protein 4) [Micromonospora echinaurantiaca]|uniref:D-alanyl-D-alanine carboxypeptidase / D-alanyl-D-alanine-endopeptidase (Penicillin-binding protein 4) n=1 Tax=Micromonospora echinaurantiaca TaxID=47857 RepID=A0A1C5K5X6_9ACTN|nr:D-alanyl-D-alanine carboxypeptidase / D-alanyl-D-alanine-endopeptidase (penicillin-binding protein 4) [Micromonospora echinaurantiaca]